MVVLASKSFVNTSILVNDASLLYSAVCGTYCIVQSVAPVRWNHM